MGWTRPRSSQANGRAGRVDQCLLQVGAAPNPYPLVAPRVKDHRVHYPVPAFVYLTSLTPRSRCAVQDARDRSRSMLTEMQPVDPAGADSCEGDAAGEAGSLSTRAGFKLDTPSIDCPGHGVSPGSTIRQLRRPGLPASPATSKVQAGTAASSAACAGRYVSPYRGAAHRHRPLQLGAGSRLTEMSLRRTPSPTPRFRMAVREDPRIRPLEAARR